MNPTPPRYKALAHDHAGTSYGVIDTFTREWVVDVERKHAHPTMPSAEAAARRLNAAYEKASS